MDQEPVRLMAELKEEEPYARVEALLVTGGDPMSILDEAKPENVRAMFDFTRSYGVY
jgi:hypothetical protein